MKTVTNMTSSKIQIVPWFVTAFTIKISGGLHTVSRGVQNPGGTPALQRFPACPARAAAVRKEALHEQGDFRMWQARSISPGGPRPTALSPRLVSTMPQIVFGFSLPPSGSLIRVVTHPLASRSQAVAQARGIPARQGGFRRGAEKRDPRPGTLAKFDGLALFWPGFSPACSHKDYCPVRAWVLLSAGPGNPRSRKLDACNFIQWQRQLCSGEGKLNRSQRGAHGSWSSLMS